MDRKKRFSAVFLTDDLLVEILSRVPFKSFCRFKSVCRAWLAFSSDPHYRGKLPKIPTGLLREDRTGIQHVSLSPNNEEIDGALTFLPRYKKLEFVDCCNGLVLCKYTSSCSVAYTHFIVCNPATQEWRELPVSEFHRYPPYGRDGSRYTTMLAFDPSWSAQSFYVFNFREDMKNSWAHGISRLEVFSSDKSTWLVDDTWICDLGILVRKPHNFIGGALHVQTSSGEILVVDGLHKTIDGMPPDKHTIKLPHDCCRFMDGCFGQSSRSLLCAFPEECGRTVAVFSLDAGPPYKWSLKHRLTMPDVLGREDNIEFCDDESWLLRCSYHIVALDFEREVFFLVDKEPKKLLVHNISTGELSKIKDGCLTGTWAYHYYVACYSKLPGGSHVRDVSG